MKRYVLYAAVLAGCWTGGTPEPADPKPVVYEPPTHPPEEPPEPPDPLTLLDPTPDPGSPYPPCYSFDPTNPTCRAACRKLGLDDVCGKCPDPPNPNSWICQQVMPCPTPPHPNVVACRPILAALAAQPKPVRARILANQVDPNNPGGVIVTIGVGSARSVARDWTFEICAEDGARFPGGSITPVRVDKMVTVGKVNLRADAIAGHPLVCVTPP